MPTTTDNISGRTAIVTGASSGIGRAIAERLGATGAHVVLSGRTESALQASAARIVDTGGSADVQIADVRDPEVVRALVDRAVEQTGRLDIMVNNAGVDHHRPILDGEPDAWREMFETNLLALVTGCQAAVRAMRASGTTGHLVNISSTDALRPDSGVYGATKHAVNTISNTLRTELVDDPIQVITIMPGAVATNVARHFDPEVVQGLLAMGGSDVAFVPGERLPDDALASAQAALSELLMTPDDVADAVLYAVGAPARVHVAEVVVRPNRDLGL